MVLGQHEAAQLRPEMPADAGRQRCCHHVAVRLLPALAAEIHDVRADHQVLHHKIRVTLEARALRRGRDCDGPLLVDRKLRSLPPFCRGSLPVGGGGLGSVALSMPLGLIFGRPGPPLSRAISSRCTATVRRNSAAPSSSFSTKLFRSACDRPSRSVGGNIPRTNPTRALL